ncbi:MAG: terminase [Magnetococcales bacterium]|nr:terminase [Magnetococcales bacterium]
MAKRKPTTNCIKRKFIEFVSQGWTIDKASKLLKTSRQNFYRWAEGDPAFAAAWAEAKEQGIAVLEDEVHRRAVEGVKEAVFHNGTVVGEKVCYSDTLLMFALKAARPEVYGHSKVEVQHSGSVDFTAMLKSAYQAAKRDGVLP